MTESSGKGRTTPRYGFGVYVDKLRWISLWHQLDAVLARQPVSVLEIGPGPGVFKAVAARFGVAVETVDIAPETCPDHLAAATELPFDDNSYDCACAFQVLEHMPYPAALQAVREMVRVAKRHVVLSLPDARAMWFYSLHVPGYGPVERLIPKPRWRAPPHVFEDEHHWEINKQGYPLKKIVADISRQGVAVVSTYRVPENSYHRFFCCEKM